MRGSLELSSGYHSELVVLLLAGGGAGQAPATAGAVWIGEILLSATGFQLADHS